MGASAGAGDESLAEENGEVLADIAFGGAQGGGKVTGETRAFH